MAFEKVLDIPHQESGEDPVALGVRDANALLGNEEFITRYAQISAEAETCEVRTKREELEQGRRLAVREVRLPIVEVRAMEYVQRDHAEIVTIDQAKRVLKKQWQEYIRIAAETLAVENREVMIGGRLVPFCDLEAEVMTERRSEEAVQFAEIARLERVARLRERVASGQVHRLLQDIETQRRYPPLQTAFQTWGRSPNAAGEMGENRQGFHAGIVHYFLYRAYPDKAGRCKDWPMSVEGFIAKSSEFASYLANPRPEDNENVQDSTLFTDADGGRRLLLLTKDSTFINAFARPGEPLRVVTVIPGYQPARFLRDVAEETAGNDEKKLNRLESGRARATMEPGVVGSQEKITRFPSVETMMSRYESLGTPEHAEAFRCAVVLAEDFSRAGGRALFVGGSVRDIFLGVTPKDFDLEVHGLPPEEVECIARARGDVAWVGKAFGILLVKTPSKVAIDLSLPRFDSLPIDAQQKEDAKKFNGSIMEAARRRDFTMNTLAADPLTGEIFDDFGGIDDIRRRIIRVTDQERFQDDALRLLRGAQFVARFGMHIDAESLEFMRSVAPKLEGITPERVREEWRKLLLKSRQPSVGIIAADSLGILDVLHADIRDREQSADENIVKSYAVSASPWAKMLARVDGVSTVCRRDRVEGDEALMMMFATMARGVKNPQRFLESVGAKKDAILEISRLLAECDVLMPWFIEDTFDDRRITDGEIRQLAERLKPATLRQLGMLLEGSYLGDMSIPGPNERESLPLPYDQNPAREWLRAKAVALQCENGPAPDCVSGKDWLAYLGAKGGREIGDLIRVTNALRDTMGWTREDVLRRVSPGMSLKDALMVLQGQLDSGV